MRKARKNHRRNAKCLANSSYPGSAPGTVYPVPGSAQGFTICVIEGAALGLKWRSPEYVVEMMWVPWLRLDVTKRARPCCSERVAKVVAPSFSVIVPVGVGRPVNVGVTETAKVTGTGLAQIGGIGIPPFDALCPLCYLLEFPLPQFLRLFRGRKREPHGYQVSGS